MQYVPAIADAEPLKAFWCVVPKAGKGYGAEILLFINQDKNSPVGLQLKALLMKL
jgi:hypothetical protein